MAESILGVLEREAQGANGERDMDKGVAMRSRRSKQFRYHEKPPENPKGEKMISYLTTWLMLYGKGFITEDEATKIDDLIDDDNEVCWSHALDKGYIYNTGWARYSAVDGKTRLTKAGLEFINHGLQERGTAWGIEVK